MPSRWYMLTPQTYNDIADGCSGGLSKLYKSIFKRDISCVYCCNEHDLAYYEGGTEADRRLADRRLRQCAALAGADTKGFKKLQRMWRCLRAWLIYYATRLFGWMYFSYAK